MYELNKIDMKRVAQIGIVCEDAQKAMDNFCALFNVPKNRRVLLDVREGENSNFSAKFGWVNYAGLQFEFIQPMGGDDKTYSDFLKTIGGGLHHIMFSADDPVSILNDFRGAGVPEVTPGSHDGEIQDPAVGYFDLKKEMGLIFEVSNKNVDAMTTLDFDQLFKK